MPRTVTERTKAYVRASAEFQFACQVRVSRPGTPVFDDIEGTYTPTGSTVYTGAARIWSVDEAGVMVAGDGSYAQRASFCSIPWDYEPVPRVDDTVTVIASDDPGLVGRSFRVIGMDGGGQMRATRRLHIIQLVESALRD